ncbi:MAG: hypothetical protein ACK4ND_13065 [Cytophagaceae bacterium]
MKTLLYSLFFIIAIQLSSCNSICHKEETLVEETKVDEVAEEAAKVLRRKDL